MARINLRRLLVLACAISLMLSYGLLWARMITTPLEYTGTDFVAFYAAARIAEHEGPAHAYDFPLQQYYEERLMGFTIPSDIVRIYLDPPFVIPLASLVTLDNFVSSLVLWNVLMALFAVVGTVLVFSILRKDFSRIEWPILLAGVVLFFPVYKSLVVGQNSAILYLGACVWLLGLLTDRDWLAGLGLAVMTVRPHLVLPLVLPFVFRRRKVWWWFLLGAAALALISLAYCGLMGVEGFLRILGFSASAASATTGEHDMNNLLGLLVRGLPWVAPDILRWLCWGVYLVSIAGLCFLWARTSRLEKKHFSLAVIVAIFTAPHFHFHDFVLLIVPIVCLMLFAVEKKYVLQRQISILPLAVSFIMLCCYFADILKQNIPYLIMLALVAPLWCPEKFFPKHSLGPLSSVT